MTITVRISWTGGTAPQVDEIEYPDGTSVEVGTVEFLGGVRCVAEVVTP